MSPREFRKSRREFHQGTVLKKCIQVLNSIEGICKTVKRTSRIGRGRGRGRGSSISSPNTSSIGPSSKSGVSVKSDPSASNLSDLSISDKYADVEKSAVKSTFSGVSHGISQVSNLSRFFFEFMQFLNLVSSRLTDVKPRASKDEKPRPAPITEIAPNMDPFYDKDENGYIFPQNEDLPILKVKDEILKAKDNHRVLIITGRLR